MIKIKNTMLKNKGKKMLIGIIGSSFFENFK